MTAMASAWVITQEGTQHDTEVIGILSARKRPEIVQEYIEWLHALLHYWPAEHMTLARYNDPSNPYPAQFATTAKGVPVQHTIMCGHNPYLVACFAKDVSLSVDGDQATLKWTAPGMPITDTSGKRPDTSNEAPVHLPLQRMVKMND
jgi:hypothetical protein